MKKEEEMMIIPLFTSENDADGPKEGVKRPKSHWTTGMEAKNGGWRMKSPKEGGHPIPFLIVQQHRQPRSREHLSPVGAGLGEQCKQGVKVRMVSGVEGGGCGNTHNGERGRRV